MSSDYLNELLTLTEYEKKFEYSVRKKLIYVITVLKQFRFTGCSSVENQNRMYRREDIKLYRQTVALENIEQFNLHPLRENLRSSDFNTQSARHLKSTTYSVSVHDCKLLKVTYTSD